MRKDRTLQKPETRSLDRAPVKVLFTNVFEGIRRKHLVKQTLTPWINKTLKRSTKVLDLDKSRNHTAWSWCHKYLFPTQMSNCYCSQSFTFQPMSLARFTHWGFLIGGYREWSHLGDRGEKKKKKRISCQMLVSEPQNGRVSSQDSPSMCPNSLCTPVLPIHSLWKEENMAWHPLSSQSSWRGLMS